MAQAAPYSASMDSDTARQLVVLGGTLLMLDAPPALVMGFDQQTFQIGQKFKGLKMIPPGIHFLSFCQLGQPGQLAPYAGRFLGFAEGQVVVMRWDPATEALVDLSDEDEAARYTLGVKRFDFDAGLAPYNLSGYAAWQRLSGHITTAVAGQLQPAPQPWFSITAEEEPTHPKQRTAAEEQLTEQLAQQAAASPWGIDQADRAAAHLQGSMQRLSTNGCKAPPLASTPSTVDDSLQPGLTNASRSSAWDGQDVCVIGELQWAYLAFLLCQSLEGFAQWKALLHLMLSSSSAIQKQPNFFAQLCTALRHQLAHGLSQAEKAAAASDDEGNSANPLGAFVTDELMAGGFLRALLQQFLEEISLCQQGPGRIARGALVVVGGFTVGAGVLSYAAFKVISPPFRGYRASPGKLPKEFVLELDFEDLDLVEKSSPLNAFQQALGRSRGQVEIRQVVNALLEGGDDTRIKGVLALIGGTQQFTGLAQVQEIRQAMQDFRAKSSVPTIAYSDAFGEGGLNDTISYYLASCFSKVYMQPSGLLSTTGLATSSVFLRQLLDRWHIQPLFVARGKYKNIINTFTESGFTKEHREATEGILQGFTTQMVQHIAGDRNLTETQVRAAINASPLKCPEAIKMGLIDEGLYRDQVVQTLAATNPSEGPASTPSAVTPEPPQLKIPDQLPRVGVKRYIMHQEQEKAKLAKKARTAKTAPQVAIIMACGSIVKGKGSVGGFSEGSEVASVPMCKLLGQARIDDKIKAVVLRIDSPGGFAVASDAICREVKRLREAGKPVIVSMAT
ncbi:hypothetical protein WJX84_001451 [Apatococcus fuscideae]|uniref:Uncharacterized protein n=1 Tax=Apatococcus fuscideae TaxID=2026836 RepID=A0AAW1TAN7_9CHLO